MTFRRLVALAATGTALAFGALHAQQAASLPEPFATPSASNNSRTVARPEGANLKVPDGFTVSLFADRLNRPRMMVYAPNGDLFVAESQPGTILVMRGGKPDEVSEYATGLENPFGMAFHDGYFYVGQTTKLVRYKYANGDLKPSAPPEKLADFPGQGHSTRNVLFSRDGKKMYVAVGSLSNKSSGEPEVRAAVNEYNPDGTGHRVFASGIRNPVGITLQPGTDTIWVSVNERDTLGDDLVPDYVTSVKDGGFYGWPYSYIGSHPDPEHKGEQPDLVARAIVPDVLIPAHSAAVSLAFYTGTQFPARYRNGVFIGLHGSWNRSKANGYKIAFVPFQNGKPSGPIEEFLSGWLVTDGPGPITTWGRPVGVTVAADGSLLVADDTVVEDGKPGGRIWRVKYGN
jgi:glucose/arabinose dehydrogenase